MSAKWSQTFGNDCSSFGVQKVSIMESQRVRVNCSQRVNDKLSFWADAKRVSVT